MHDFTVLTMFGDAWGSATDPAINRAIVRAIANCKAMSGAELGCGGYLHQHPGRLEPGNSLRARDHHRS